MKIVNFVLGLTTAIILSALIILGIKAFYPEPVAPTYPNYPIVPVAAVPCASADIKCQTGQTTVSTEQQATYQAQQQDYDNQMGIYDEFLFVIANVVGIIVFAVGFWLVFGAVLVSNAIPVGIMLAGLWSIMYGYASGWGSVGDQIKFFIGLIIAVLVIGGSAWLMQRYHKNPARKGVSKNRKL